jgi:hypothetical protein
MNKKYTQLIIYYFSGTGNAKHCAAWICGTAKNFGITAEMFDISKTAVRSIMPPAAGTLVGFCSPTHGFLIAFFYLFSISISAGIAYLLANFNAGEYFYWIKNDLIKFIITSAVILPFYFLTYRIIHFLMRFRVIERIMTLTSLTHLKYWGRYKASKKF